VTLVTIQLLLKQQAPLRYMKLNHHKVYLFIPEPTMSRNLYSPRLSDDVVRALYREGQRRRMPMTRVADDLLRQSLGSLSVDPPVLRVCEDLRDSASLRRADAA
jgi:hypothetical protein